jgi:hypothetical protein
MKTMNWTETKTKLEEQITLIDKTRHAIRGRVIHVEQHLPSGGVFHMFLAKNGKITWAPGSPISDIRIFSRDMEEQESATLVRAREIVNGWMQGNPSNGFRLESIPSQEGWDIIRENLVRTLDAVNTMIAATH